VQRIPQSTSPWSGRLASWCAAVVAVPVVVASVFTGPAVSAQPKPSKQELTTQLEKLTEKYNGLRVQLKQARRAAAATAASARSQQQNYDAMREKVGQLAAQSYKNGGLDPAVGLASAKDPQALLDQSATLDYITSQGSAQARTVLLTLQQTVRTRKAAQDRLAAVQQLTGQLDQQRKHIQSLLAKAGVATAKGQSGGKGPAVSPGGASAKALGAVKAALAKLGRPYVWGAAGPSTFDCSGLTMWAYGQVGVSLPHYTGSQFSVGTHVSQSQLRPGDLVFFYSDLHHMGMYIGNGQMVHAPHTGDVVKIAPIAGRPFAGAVRVA
jgi:cell wall-associated NlpC family hydrolase